MYNYFIFKLEWISSEILNIMSIDTCSSIMLLCIWAPNSFILIEIEIMISSLQMNNLDFNLGLIMSKSTEFLVLAFSWFIMINLTKFTLISGRMINLLDFVMRVWTFYLLTFFICTHLMAIIFKIRSSFVEIIVVKNTSFSLMMIFIRINITSFSTNFSFMGVYIKTEKLSIFK